MDVTLTHHEIDLANYVAKLRDINGRAARADNNKYGNAAPSLPLHLLGCLGELATAKGLNIYWSGAGTSYQQESDVGFIQVRTTTHLNGRLLIRPDETKRDTINHPWVLVIQHDIAHYTLPGWIIGIDGVKNEYLDNPNKRGPAYFIPQGALRDLRQLEELRRAHGG